MLLSRGLLLWARGFEPGALAWSGVPCAEARVLLMLPLLRAEEETTVPFSAPFTPAGRKQTVVSYNTLEHLICRFHIHLQRRCSRSSKLVFINVVLANSGLFFFFHLEPTCKCQI